MADTSRGDGKDEIEQRKKEALRFPERTLLETQILLWVINFSVRFSLYTQKNS